MVRRRSWAVPGVPWRQSRPVPRCRPLPSCPRGRAEGPCTDEHPDTARRRRGHVGTGPGGDRRPGQSGRRSLFSDATFGKPSVRARRARRGPDDERTRTVEATMRKRDTHPAGQAAGDGAPTGRRALMLTLATIGFAVNFWAWALLSPLAPRFKDALHLTSFQQALLVAVPVVVGS